MSGRTNSQGGIQKRPAGPRARVDRDGDLDMDAPNGKGRGGRGKRRGGRGGKGGNNSTNGSAPRSNPMREPAGTRSTGTRGTRGRDVKGGKNNSWVPIQIMGWKDCHPTGEACIDWLEKKSSVKVMKTATHGSALIAYVVPKMVDEFLQLNNSRLGKGQIKLSSELNDFVTRSLASNLGQNAFSPDEVRQRLKGVLNRRYDEVQKLLNLAHLGSDHVLQETGFFELGTTTTKLFPVLMIIADERFENLQRKREMVVSISLAENGLTNLQPVTELARTFPDLKNLDLSRNKITSVKALERWRNKFRLLEQLLFIDNPIVNEPGYREEIIRMFPNLTLLDNIPVDRPAVQVQERTSISSIVQQPSTAVDAKGKAILPLPTKAGFVDPTIGGVTMDFLSMVFTLYDTNREELLRTYYDEQSQFSINVNTSAPRVQETTNKRQFWDVYIPQSRNFKRIEGGGPVSMQRHHQGLASIFEAWKKLPETRHNLSEVDNWIFDIWPGPRGTIVATVHSEFEEATNHPECLGGVMKRSFDRHFMLRPDGQSVKVVSDLLTLRSFAGAEAWKEAVLHEAANMQAAAPTAAPPTTTPAPLGTTLEPNSAEKLNLCGMLSKESGLTLEFSEQCLANNNWDLEQSWNAFTSAKAAGLLGPEAFAGGPAPAMIPGAPSAAGGVDDVEL